jgi:hypothetical protein
MGDTSTSDYDCEEEIMPRVNLALSDEAKKILDTFQKEKGLRQDEAANALLLLFQDKQHIAEHLADQTRVVAALVARLGGSVEIKDLELQIQDDLYLSRRGGIHDDHFCLKLVHKEGAAVYARGFDDISRA